MTTQPTQTPTAIAQYATDQMTARGTDVTTIANAIAAEMKNMVDADEEMQAFGAPSECAALVYRQTARDLRQILTDAGLTPTLWYAVLADRTSEKFAYFSGLGGFNLMDDDDSRD